VLVQTLDNNLWYLYSGRPNSPNPYYWVDGYVAQFQAHPSDPSVIMVLSASDGKLWREHWDMNDRQKIADGVTSFQDPVTNYPSPVIFTLHQDKALAEVFYTAGGSSSPATILTGVVDFEATGSSYGVCDMIYLRDTGNNLWPHEWTALCRREGRRECPAIQGLG
jgi:Ser/Thr protein kinase RdoA (MazF antagonist)